MIIGMVRAFHPMNNWIFIFTCLENTIRGRHFDHRCLIIIAWPCSSAESNYRAGTIKDWFPWRIRRCRTPAPCLATRPHTAAPPDPNPRSNNQFYSADILYCAHFHGKGLFKWSIRFILVINTDKIEIWIWKNTQKPF